MRRCHEQRVDWRLGGESACGPNREMLCKRGVRKKGTRIQTCGVRLVCFGCCCGSGFWPCGVLGALALGDPGVCPVGDPVGGSGREARGGSQKNITFMTFSYSYIFNASIRSTPRWKIAL